MSGYLELHRTGNEKFDAVLSAIENAGREYPNILYWDETCDLLEGKSYIEIINLLIINCQETN